MTITRFTTTLLALLTLLLASTLTHAGTTVSAREYHFTITYPDGWNTMPRSEVNALNGNLPSPTVHFVSGARRGPTTPYALVQLLPAVSNETVQQVIDDFTSGTPSGDRILSTRHDTALNAVVINTRIANLDAHTYIFPGKERSIAIHCYALPSEAAAAKSAFEEIAASFQFDPGHQGHFAGTEAAAPAHGDPEAAESESSPIWLIISCIACAVIAVVVVAALALILFLVLRRKKQP